MQNNKTEARHIFKVMSSCMQAEDARGVFQVNHTLVCL
jgi:hypothetical protein